MNCLGCGAGDVTFEITRLIGQMGRVTGMYMDSVKLDLARERATKEGIRNVEFRQANVFEWGEDSVYDLIFVRFLPTHLPECEKAVRSSCARCVLGALWL
jgi:demethylmenaquinone methyltransferase/2-methoxy-6-polyprenyl-1,4-benzoquinol methylase